MDLIQLHMSGCNRSQSNQRLTRNKGMRGIKCLYIASLGDVLTGKDIKNREKKVGKREKTQKRT